MIYIYLISTLLFLLFIYLAKHTYVYRNSSTKYLKFKRWHIICIIVAYIIPVINLIVSGVLLLALLMAIDAENLYVESALVNWLNKEV